MAKPSLHWLVLMGAILIGLLVAPRTAHAGTFSYDCTAADISCDEVFDGLVTDRFTRHFPADRWVLVVYSSTIRFSKGGGVTHAFVGVAPKSKADHTVMPKRLWTVSAHHEDLPDARSTKTASKRAVRRALDNMMTECDEADDCALVSDSK